MAFMIHLALLTIAVGTQVSCYFTVDKLLTLCYVPSQWTNC